MDVDPREMVSVCMFLAPMCSSVAYLGYYDFNVGFMVHDSELFPTPALLSCAFQTIVSISHELDNIFSI